MSEKEEPLEQRRQLRVLLLRLFSKLQKRFTTLAKAHPDWLKEEKYLRYRTTKRAKKQVAILLTPTSKQVYHDSQVQNILKQVKLTLALLRTINRRLGQDRGQERAELITDLIDSKATQEAFLPVIEFLHELSADEMLLHAEKTPRPIKSIAVLASDHGGFGDILFAIKLFHALKKIAGNTIKITVTPKDSKSRGKLLQVGFEERDLHEPNQPTDVLISFKGFAPAMDYKLLFVVEEYDYGYAADVLLGFNHEHLGLITAFPPYDPHARETVTRFLQERGLQEHDIPRILSAHLSLCYPSTLTHAYDYVRQHIYYALQARPKLDKDVVIFCPLEFETVITEQLRKHSSWQLHDVTNKPRTIRFETKGMKVEAIFCATVPHEVFLAMLRLCDLPVLITGDQSLTEALVLEKPFFYATADWKTRSLRPLAKLFWYLGGPDLGALVSEYEMPYIPRWTAKIMTPKRVRLAISLFHDKELQERFKAVERKITRVDFSAQHILSAIHKRWNPHVRF